MDTQTISKPGKRRGWSAAHWLILGAAGAGAYQVFSRMPKFRSRTSPVDDALEEAKRSQLTAAFDAPTEEGFAMIEETSSADLSINAPVLVASSTPVAAEVTGDNSLPESGSKMTDASPLREREHEDLPDPGITKTKQSVVVDQHGMDAADVVAGGEPGSRDGDRQKIGEVPTVMDQREAVPDFAQQQ